PDKDVGMVLDIADGGKLTMYVTRDGKMTKVDGTYTVNGDKIEVELAYNGKKIQDTLTVTKLTDTELTTKDQKGAEEALKRVKKDEKKDEKKEKDKEK